MSRYQEMTKAELKKELDGALARYQEYCAKNLSLDMTRGKPCKDQLELSMEMLGLKNYCSEAGVDCRNYGILDGVPEMKTIFADLLDVTPDEIIVGGNSSLNLMHDCVVNALLIGVSAQSTPWIQQGKLKFLCPVPGYDRHFCITEKFGFEMIPVPMDENGPDMDMVEHLVSTDPAVKGIWCVPKYANPGGITYSAETVRRFAALRPAAEDFRIFWDNAYAVHDLTDTPDELLNIFEACKEQGSEDMVYEFTSTSKISVAGAGVACIAASKNNVQWLKKQLGIQTIGYDKLNQLRHVAFFRNKEGVMAQMKKHAAIIGPKFDIVLATLERELGDKGIATWTKPKGGYFISYDQPGCASRITELAAKAGLAITPAGSTYPCRQDPADGNLRIAPTLPEVDELKMAAEIFCLCAQIVAAEKILAE